jgi:hypothetical protein
MFLKIHKTSKKSDIDSYLASELSIYYFFVTQVAGAGSHAGVLPEPKGGYHLKLPVVIHFER